MDQKKQYIGIPLEVKWFMSKKNMSAMPYLKVGCTLNYCLNTNTSVHFQDAAMEKYSDEIKSRLPETSSFFASFYPAFGVRFGKENYDSRWNPWFNLEMRLGEIVLSENLSSFTKYNITGFGAQIALQIPSVFPHRKSVNIPICCCCTSGRLTSKTLRAVCRWNTVMKTNC